MNPEDNQTGGAVPNAAAPTTPAAPADPTTSTQASPDLDQLAVDLANTAPTELDVAEAATPSVALPTDLTGGTPAIDNPVTADPAPATPVQIEVAEAPAAPVAETPVADTPVAPAADTPVEAPAAIDPAVPAETPTSPAPGVTPEATETTEPVSETPTDTPADTSTDAPTDTLAEEDSEKTYSEDDPIQPAEPTPGSIGSAIAYDENSPNHSVPVTFKKDPEDIKKQRNIIIIAIAAIIVVGVIGAFIALLIANNNKDAGTVTPSVNPGTAASDMSTVSCTREMDSDSAVVYTLNGSEPGYVQEKFVATYDGEDFYDAAKTVVISYTDTVIKDQATSLAKSVYKDQLTAAGLVEDPFESNYNYENGITTVYHYVEADKLNEENAGLVGIDVTGKEVESGLKNVVATFKTKGYLCSVKADE